MKTKLNIQYLVNEEGEKTSVIVPVKEWVDLMTELSQYRQANNHKKEDYPRPTVKKKPINDLPLTKNTSSRRIEKKRPSLNLFLEDI